MDRIWMRFVDPMVGRMGGPMKWVVLALTLVSAGAFAATQADLEEALSHDGLAKVSVKGLALAYLRPGATLAGYSKVKLDPVEVAFRKDWNPKRTGSYLKLSAADRENIRTGVAKIVQEEFVKEIQKKSTYQMASEAGPDVLRVRLSIVNLYANAPDTKSAGTYSFAVSAGEMTLFAELYDSETGQVLARIVDRREGRNTGTMQLSSSVVGAGEAQDIAAAWARILRDALDKAHGVGKK